MNSYGFYLSKTDTFKIDLEPCKPEVFTKAINPMKITDCIMLPDGLEYDVSPISAVLPLMELIFSFKCDDVFRCSGNSEYFNNSIKYIVELNQNYYF